MLWALKSPILIWYFLLHLSGSSEWRNELWGGLYTDEMFWRATVMVSICLSVLWVQTSSIVRFGLLNTADPYCRCRISATTFIPGMAGRCCAGPMWVSCMHTMSKRLAAVASMSALHLKKPSILMEAIDSASAIHSPEGASVCGAPASSSR